jgi:hypothetical protein
MLCLISPQEQPHARVLSGYRSQLADAGRDRVPSSCQVETRS